MMDQVQPVPHSDLVLQVKSLGKLYSRNRKATRKRLAGTALRALFGFRPKPIETLRGGEFWALDDVSFDLRRGEALGVIGLNGSGKTTLLRLLAGQLVPDRGEVWVKGTSAAMIDLQAGFQSSASGRENVFLRAAALGFRRTQTREKYDEIVAFSELGDAIDAPLASYSSGMRMRLAFSIMITVSPDLLFIDEVLAVGDFRFRQKCLGKVRELRERSAFVLVSHSMYDISRFCDRAIVLHKGRVHFEGDPDEAVEVYESLNPDVPSSDNPANLTRAMGPTYENSDAIINVHHEWCDMNGNPIERIEFDQPFQLSLSFKSLIDIRSLVVGVPIWNTNAQYLTGLSTQITSQEFQVCAGETLKLRVEIDRGHLNPGVLKSILTIIDGPEYLYRKNIPDLTIGAPSHPTWGAITVPHKWVQDESEPVA